MKYINIATKKRHSLWIYFIAAFLRVDPTFGLVYYRKSDLTFACRVLKDYITKREIQVKRNFDQITQSQDWKRLEQDIAEYQKGKVRFLKDVSCCCF